ncbi:hypothetical protein F4859DRAFT_529593 [Xylaria cf. heliscus]|nr:hypothetical protein F4859DRAFT_529593 [Xylaria cf. heliscus]
MAHMEDVQHQLTSLMTDNRAPLADDMIHKECPLDSQKPSLVNHTCHPSVRRVFVYDLPPEERGRARAIFRELQHMQFERAPRLIRRDISAFSGRVAVGYPPGVIKWLGKFCLRGTRKDLDSLRSDVAGLRKYVMDDIDRLWAKRIAYIPNLTKLELVKESAKPGNLKPFIGFLNFDFSLDMKNRKLPWDELKAATKWDVEAQFETFEFIMKLAMPKSDPPPDLSIDLDPNIVSTVVQTASPYIGYLKEYREQLGMFLVDARKPFIIHLDRHLDDEVEQQKKRDKITLYISMIDNTLRLINRSIQDEGKHVLDRAALLVARALMLIELHIEYSPDCLDFNQLQKSWVYAYTTGEGYLAVEQSRCEAENAVRELTKADITLLNTCYDGFRQLILELEGLLRRRLVDVGAEASWTHDL